jgi:molybdopterin-guanine dinucleotide biosynthesis protein A
MHFPLTTGGESMNVRCAAIIAGGASRRMGTSKALLNLDGQPLIARIAALLRSVFPELVVVTPSSEIAEAAGAPALPDAFPGKGPLAGIHAALWHLGQPVFCCACDMPSLNADFIRYLCDCLDDYDAVVPRLGTYDEPLHAVYALSCLEAIESELRHDHIGPVDNIYGHLRVLFIDAEDARRFDPALRMFENWNTPEEVKKSIASQETA